MTRIIHSVKYLPRVPALLALEGWYSFSPPFGKDKKFKISCRYHDMLRASRSKHFISCFREEGMHEEQREMRLVNPNWALAYLPDKSGDFQARMFLEYVTHAEKDEYERGTCNCTICMRLRGPAEKLENPYVKIYKRYGNGLEQEQIVNVCNMLGITCQTSTTDKYL